MTFVCTYDIANTKILRVKSDRTNGLTLKVRTGGAPATLSTFDEAWKHREADYVDFRLFFENDDAVKQFADAVTEAIIGQCH